MLAPMYTPVTCPSGAGNLLPPFARRRLVQPRPAARWLPLVQHIAIQRVHEFPSAGLDVIRQLDERLIDIAISWFAAVSERFGRARLMEEGYVLVVRKGHPLATGEVTVARVLSHSHFVVDYVGNGERLTDGFFSERGVLRRVHIDRAVIEAPQRLEQYGRIAVKVPSFSNAASVIIRTDLVASIPKRLEKKCAKFTA